MVIREISVLQFEKFPSAYVVKLVGNDALHEPVDTAGVGLRPVSGRRCKGKAALSPRVRLRITLPNSLVVLCRNIKLFFQLQYCDQGD